MGEIKAWRTEFRQREGRKPHSKDRGAIQGKYAMYQFYTLSYEIAAAQGKLTADDQVYRPVEDGNETAVPKKSSKSLSSASANAPSSSQSPEPDFDAAAAMLGKDDAMAVMGDLWDEAKWEAAEKDEQGKIRVDHFIKIAEPLSKAAAKAGARQTYAEIKAWRTEFRQREGRKPHSKDKGAIQGKYAMYQFYTLSYEIAAAQGKLTADDQVYRPVEDGNETAVPKKSSKSLSSASANAPSSSQSPEPDFDAAAAMLGKDDAMAVMGDLWDEANWEAAEKDEQ